MTRSLILASFAAMLAFTLMPSAHLAYAQTAAPATGGNPTGSPANRDLKTKGADGKSIRCAEVKEAKAGVLLGYIIPCMVKTIEGATVTFSQKMIDWLKPTVFAFMTFVITMFGVKVVQSSGPEIYKEGFLLLIKIGFVLALMDIIPKSVPVVYDTIASSQEIVTSVVGENGIKCDIAKYRDGNTPLLWAQMDCLVGKLYGFTTGAADSSGNKQPNMLLAASVLGVMGGIFFGGSFGVALFFVLVGVLWSILQLVLKVALAFINGYLIVCLMLIISPLFLPLILLKATAQFFDQWWKLMLGGVLLPVIVTAYAMFAMLMYDKLLFSDKALIKELFNYDKVKQAQNAPRQVCDKQVSGLSNSRTGSGATADALKKVMENPFMQNFSNVLSSGSNNLCAGLQVPTFDLGKVNSDAFKKGKETFTALFKTAIKLFVMAILIEEGLKTLTNNIRTLVPTSAPTSSLSASGKLEQEFQGRVQNAKSELTRGLKGDEGDTGFAQRIGPAIQGSVKQLINPGS
ncbi:MAG: hypothetical protein ACKVOE_06925 [Rickettsiales bacterium]